MSGTITFATTATARLVTTTAPTARPSTGCQLRRRSRREVANPASSRTGARNRASARSGSSAQVRDARREGEDDPADGQEGRVRCAKAARQLRQDDGAEQRHHGPFENQHPADIGARDAPSRRNRPLPCFPPSPIRRDACRKRHARDPHLFVRRRRRAAQPRLPGRAFRAGTGGNAIEAMVAMAASIAVVYPT